MDLLTGQMAELLPLLLLAIGIGTMGGFLSGLLGIGGGFIYVPALFFAFTSLGFEADYAMHIAVGTSLAIVAPTVFSSAICHYKRGGLETTIFKRWALFLMSGVGCGVLLAAYLNAAHMIMIFTAIALSVAIYMGFMKDPYQENKAIKGRKRHYPIATGIGFVASMMGIGGSIITVPTMTFLNVPMQKAIGTAAAMAVLTAVTGVIGFMAIGTAHAEALPLTIGYVNIIAVLTVVPISILMAPQGCKVAHKLPKQKLRRVFAILIACVAIKMLTDVQVL